MKQMIRKYPILSETYCQFATEQNSLWNLRKMDMVHERLSDDRNFYNTITLGVLLNSHKLQAMVELIKKKKNFFVPTFLCIYI